MKEERLASVTRLALIATFKKVITIISVIVTLVISSSKIIFRPIATTGTSLFGQSAT